MVRLRASTVCAVRFSTSLRVIIAESKLYTDLCAKSQPSSLHEATEGADSPKLDPDSKGVTKIKVSYNLVLLTGIPVVCMISACHAPFGSDARTKKSYLFFM